MKFYQPRSMLVTGGAGFIGSNFIRYVLANEPHINIVNVDKLTYAGTLDNLKKLPHPERHCFIQGDIINAEFVHHVMMHHHIDTIVHFAAESHVDRSIATPAPFVETNVMGTLVLLEAARHHWLDVKRYEKLDCRFHHVSTDEVYGSLNIDDSAFTENTVYNPRSPYSATKAGSDHLVRSYYHTYGLPITISNCSNNYGPYQHQEKFIPTVIRSCLNWQRIPIYSTGKNIRDWLYVDDHCNGIMTIVKKGKVGKSYNIGGNAEWQNIAIARYICHLLDELLPRIESYETLLEFVRDRLGHDFRYALNTTKINSELGWIAQETLQSGMNKTIKFYLNQGFRE